MPGQSLSFILDTSALFGLSRVRLERASEEANLFISPITIYELLCHLDEIEGGGDTYSRRRGNLLKCLIPQLLDTPFADMARAMGIPQAVNPSQFEEREVLLNLLRILDGSSSLDQFYSNYILLPDGTRGVIRDVASRMRQVSQEENDLYADRVRRTRHGLLQLFPVEQIRTLSPTDYIDIDITNETAHRLLEQLVIYRNDSQQVGRVFSSLYPYQGYILERAIRYIRYNPRDPVNSPIDPNDTEDSLICLHMNLHEERILVTGDGGTFNALANASERIRAWLRNVGLEGQISTLAITPDHFCQQLGI